MHVKAKNQLCFEARHFAWHKEGIVVSANARLMSCHANAASRGSLHRLPMIQIHRAQDPSLLLTQPWPPLHFIAVSMSMSIFIFILGLDFSFRLLVSDQSLR